MKTCCSPLWRTMQTIQKLTKIPLGMPRLAASGGWAAKSVQDPLATSTKVSFLGRNPHVLLVTFGVVGTHGMLILKF